MKSKTKRTGALIAAAALATTFAAAGTFFLGNKTTASAAENEGKTYFYQKLGNDLNAKKFYDAFKALNDDGTFKTGKVEYDLVANGVVTSNEVAAYVGSGDKRIPKAYGAGRDSFIMDTPDLFYVDLFGTSISAGTQGEEYAAYLDSSRVTSLYIGELNTKSKIEEAIEKYEAKLNLIVTGAKAAGSDLKEQIKYVNKYICDNTEYSYGTEVVGDKNVDTPAAAYINTAYGSLVNGKAICGGYSLGFKAVMDRLDIPCVCVQGYSIKADGSTVPHMWNTVKLEGQWYNVDVTFNDTGSNSEKYLFTGAISNATDHIIDPEISSSGFELDYPATKPYDFGVDTDENGMSIQGSYDDGVLELTVSFEKKGGEKLHDEGKYLAFRLGNKEGEDTEWTAWFSAVEANEAYAPFWSFEDKESKIYVYSNSQCVQFALINRAPDESFGATYPDSGQPFYYGYKAENLKDSDFIVKPSAPYENEAHDDTVSPPFGNPSPWNPSYLPTYATYDIVITYTEDLQKIDPGKEVTMDYTTSSGNDDRVKEHAQLKDFSWDGKRTVTFKFSCSKLYEHNMISYYFVPTNLQGVKSKLVPTPVRFAFETKTVICSKVFNDGRLFMDVFGQPKLIDNSDISVTQFKDENGKYYAESQRSQLMLVASKPDEAREKELNETLLNETELEKDDIVTSATYEIDLQICGVVRTVPNGSYMQVSFGFPEGYTPNDKGTTYKIYHYKHEDPNDPKKITGVEEIPVIITEYGLIAKVHSFSPFTIVQIKNTSAVVDANEKTVYASANGNGSITDANGKSGITTLKNGTLTYTIAAEKDYQVARVMLNGKAVDSSRYENGTLMLTYEELAESNMVEATFVTKESAQSYEQKGIEIADIEMPVLLGSSSAITPTPNPAPAEGNSDTNNAGVWIAVGCVLGVLVLGGAAVAVVLIMKKKKAK